MALAYLPEGYNKSEGYNKTSDYNPSEYKKDNNNSKMYHCQTTNNNCQLIIE